MTKILFICRSPMAKFVLKDMVKEQCISDNFYISSCAISTEEIWGDKGNPICPPTKEELAKHGIVTEIFCMNIIYDYKKRSLPSLYG